MSEEAVLNYFENRGYGEIIRLTLCLAKIPFRQVFLTKREEYLKLCEDGKLLFGQLPLLQIDGINLVQHNAAIRYVAEKGNLVPTDMKERAKMNMFSDSIRCTMEVYIEMGFDLPLKDPNIQKLFDRYFPIYNKELKSSCSGYLVGDSQTLADAQLLELLLNAVDLFGEEVLEGYQSLQNFVLMMKSKPEVVTYLEKIRLPPNDAERVQVVKNIISHCYYWAQCTSIACKSGGRDVSKLAHALLAFFSNFMQVFQRKSAN